MNYGVATRRRGNYGYLPHFFSKAIKPLAIGRILMTGWIQLHRNLVKWEWYSDVNTCHLFIHLLLSANHQETRWRGQVILPGQLLTGRGKLAETSGLSERSVRTSLHKLKTTSEVTSKSYNKYSVITITNWSKYQSYPQGATSKRPASDQQATTSNNHNNENNVKNQDQGDPLKFNIERYLTDKTRQAAKEAVPGKDVYYYIPIYNGWMQNKIIPDNPVGSFINWLKSYTKNEEFY